MRKFVIILTTFMVSLLSCFSVEAQVNDDIQNFGTGLELWHIDSNLAGTALVENGIGFHYGGVETIFDNPQNSLWFAIAAMLGVFDENSNEIVLTGEDAEEFLDRLYAAEDRGDITITTTSVDVNVEIPENSGTVRVCLDTIFGCITIREIPDN